MISSPTPDRPRSGEQLEVLRERAGRQFRSISFEELSVVIGKDPSAGDEQQQAEGNQSLANRVE